MKSLTPTLRWESFPRPQDADASRISNVTYDLRYCQSGGSWIDVAGLHQPEYRFATPLKGNTGYTWTVRANFDFDGRPRVSQWTEYLGATSPDGVWTPGRFRTPK